MTKKRYWIPIIVSFISNQSAFLLQEIRFGSLKVKPMPHGLYIVSGIGIMILHFICLTALGNLWLVTKKDSRRTAHIIVSALFVIVLFGVVMSAFLVVFPGNI